MNQSQYCLLYKSNPEIYQSAKPESEEEDEESSKSNNFWNKFQWTEQDSIKAEKELSENLSKCNILENSPAGRGTFFINKLEKEAGLNWDKFYSSHQTNFFKDRHYLEKAFPDEFGIVYGNSSLKVDPNGEIADVLDVGGNFTIAECGCGVGNTVLPLLELDPVVHVPGKNGVVKKNLVVLGFDFSSTGIQLLQQDTRYIKANNEGRSHAAVWDITRTPPSDVMVNFANATDISLLLFCLSAISPGEPMKNAAVHVAQTLKPGGTLIFRDYGRYDEAQMKLGKSRGKRIGENFYVKHDGTRCYYFELKDLEYLFSTQAGTGLEVLELKYIQREYSNRSDDTVRRRIWVQGRFRKPIQNQV
jgi:methyltransferase-like protein 6